MMKGEFVNSERLAAADTRGFRRAYGGAIRTKYATFTAERAEQSFAGFALIEECA